MSRLAQTHGLTDVQQEILSTVRDFVDKEIIPCDRSDSSTATSTRRESWTPQGTGSVRDDPRGVRGSASRC